MTKPKHNARQKKDIGEIGEWFVYTELTKMGIESSRKIFGGKGWDIVTIDGLIIEVKTSVRARYHSKTRGRDGNVYGWQFRLSSDHTKLIENMDFVVCVALYEDYSVYDVWIYPPTYFVGRNQIATLDRDYLAQTKSTKSSHRLVGTNQDIYRNNWNQIIQSSRLVAL
jgi:hypothetical protein